ncbi:MAG TPA: serine protease [Thermodesulfobacteriota bacterium]|nr:serine protease [Thermodesulfobacteriota bacterium]
MRKWAFILSLLTLPSVSFADPELRVYPMPMAEAETIVARWLAEAGFEVSRSYSETGEARLGAGQGKDAFAVVLAPRSAISSAIGADFNRENNAIREKLDPLWSFLDRYSGGGRRGNGEEAKESASFSPDFDSVASVRASTGKGEVQFSAFFIGGHGTLLATAHDLEEVRSITVTLPGGREVAARILKKDGRRDLALIKTEHDSFPWIIPGKAEKPRQGDKIFAACRGKNGDGKILVGRISTVRVRSNHVPLVQAEMEAPPGCSGSPVFDEGGNFFSILKGRHRDNHSIGFLIPLETILEFLNER